jgi:hypothetical protein
VLSGFRLTDTAGTETFIFQHGGGAVLSFDFFINDPELSENCQIIVVFKRNGVEDLMRLKADDLRFDAGTARSGRIEMRLGNMRLGTGRYTVTVMAARERYFETQTGQFFSINPDVYDVHSGCLEFEVTAPGEAFATGTGIVETAEWRLS